jgi:hypothetical protein
MKKCLFKPLSPFWGQFDPNVGDNEGVKDKDKDKDKVNYYSYIRKILFLNLILITMVKVTYFSDQTKGELEVVKRTPGLVSLTIIQYDNDHESVATVSLDKDTIKLLVDYLRE